MALGLTTIPEYSSSSAIKGGGAKEKKQESPAAEAENGINGTIFPTSIGMLLGILRKGGDQDNEMVPNWVADTSFLLFEKTLECGDTLLFFPRLVIESCNCKDDQVKEALDRRLKGKDLAAYVCASTIDRWRRSYNLRVSRFENEGGWGYFIHHEWGDVVTANALKMGDKIWCWGRILHNSGIQMKIEVDKCG